MRNVTYRLLKIMLIVVAISMVGSFTHAQTLGSLHLSTGSNQGNEQLVVEEGMSLKQALERVEQQFNVVFLYRTDALADKKISGTKMLPNNVEKALEALLEEQGRLVFKYLNPKTYGIYEPEEIPKKKEPVVQQVSGQVTDAQSGKTLPGVNILVKGTTTGTSTDTNGNFELEVSSLQDTLVVTYIGYQRQEVPIGGRTEIDIALQPQAIAGEELVVVGYGSYARENLTSSVGEVKGQDISEVPVGNVTTALSGKVAGLQVMNRQGRPGNDQSELNIRGFGDPLVLVDGVEQDFGNIDPNAIESITVLKDASASIYGARAGNGVILVTTKRGVIGEPQFSYKSTFTISTPTRLVDFVDAPTYATLKNEANIADGLDPIYTEEEIQKYRMSTDPAYPNTDWWDETFKTWAPMQDHNLGVRGGTESIRYFASLGFKDQGSILRSNDLNFKRYSVRSNVDVNFTEEFTAAVDITGRLERSTQPGVGGFQADNPFPAIMEAIQRAKPTVRATFPDSTKIPYAGYEGLSNPLALSQKDQVGYVDNNFQNFRGSLKLNYDLSKLINGLNIEGSFNYRVYDREIRRWITGFNYYSYDPVAELYNTEESFNSGKNTLREDFSRTNYWKTSFRLDYQNIFLEKNEVSGLLIYEAISDEAESHWLYREGFISKEIDQFFAGSDINKDNGGTAIEDGRASYVGRFNYSFDNRYLAEFQFRYDASPRFSPENRWGFFPGLSLGWRLSEENFFNDIDTIDELKIRASYGEAGDQANIRFNYLTGYEFQGDYAFGLNETVGTGIEQGGLANPGAVWAETKTYNVGLDGSMWNDLLSFELDVFYREKTGMLAQRSESVPETFGATLPEENINSLNDRGFELVLGHNNQVGEVSYFVNANISWARSKWMHFDEPEFEGEQELYRYKRSGRWRNVTYGYIADGLFSSQEEIDGWSDITNGANNNVIRPGDIRYIDLNNDGVLNWRDERIIGKSENPTTFYGLNTGFSFKNIDFSMLWQGAAGYSKFYNEGFRSPFRIEQVPFGFWENRWHEGNQDPNKSLPRIRNGTPDSHPNTDRQSTFWIVEDAYFIRLKEARLSYQLPNTLLQIIGNLNQLEIFAAGTNLATITNVKYMDPEASDQTFRYYPQQRTLSLGLNVQF